MNNIRENKMTKIKFKTPRWSRVKVIGKCRVTPSFAQLLLDPEMKRLLLRVSVVLTNCYACATAA